MNKRTLGTAAALLVFAGLVTLQVLSTGRAKLPLAIVMPDGSTLRLMQVSYGKEHPGPGKWWYPLARRLPASWQARLNVNHGMVMTSSEPTLGLWCALEGAGTATHGWDFGMVDEQGAEVPVTNGNSYSSDPAGGPAMRGWTFGAFPRRGKSLTLRIYTRNPKGERVLAGQLQIPNPVRGRFPEWRPRPLPAMESKGDLKIEFKRLLVGVGNGGELETSRNNESTQCRAEFLVTENGTPSDHWIPDGVELSDASGNSVRQNGWSSGVQRGAATMTWQPYLWPSETAWKMRFEFMRNAQAMFTTNELVLVSGLELPATNSVTELNLATNRLGHTVRVLGLLNGQGEFPGRHSSMGGGNLRLEVEVNPKLDGKRLTVFNVRDDRGREVSSHGHGWGGTSYSFSYRPEPDAKSLSFTLAVQEVVTAEFLVKPEVFVPAKETPKGTTK